MKILDVFKSKSGESELDKALAGIIALEKARRSPNQGLEAAKAASVRGTQLRCDRR